MKHPIGIAAALGIVLLGFPCPSQGQVAPSDRVRIIGPDKRSPALVGTVVRATPDTLWLSSGDPARPTVVPLATAELLERSLGRKSHTLTGALVGAGVGAAITVLFLSGFCGGDTLCDGDEQVRAAAIFGIPSIAMGAGIGALIRTERWERVATTPSRAPTFYLGLRVTGGI